MRKITQDLSSKIRSAAANLWHGFRQATGDAAYESYLRSKSRKNLLITENPVATPPLSQQDFYLDSLRRKYSTINRCC
jgi:Selenoprotein, putative